MKKKVTQSIATLITLALLSYVTYCCLLRDNFLHISISTIISNSHDLDIVRHLLVLGLLPFYIAGMVFGTAILGIYLGYILHMFLIHLKNRLFPSKLTA